MNAVRRSLNSVQRSLGSKSIGLSSVTAGLDHRRWAASRASPLPGPRRHGPIRQVEPQVDGRDLARLRGSPCVEAGPPTRPPAGRSNLTQRARQIRFPPETRHCSPAPRGSRCRRTGMAPELPGSRRTCPSTRGRETDAQSIHLSCRPRLAPTGRCRASPRRCRRSSSKLKRCRSRASRTPATSSAPAPR